MHSIVHLDYTNEENMLKEFLLPLNLEIPPVKSPHNTLVHDLRKRVKSTTGAMTSSQTV